MAAGDMSHRFSNSSKLNKIIRYKVRQQ